MQEIFLTTHIADDDLSKSVGILQGYCGMKPDSLLRRRLLWEGPRNRSDLTGVRLAFIMNLPPQKQPFWRALHEQLIRQSYVITLVYDHKPDDFGRSEVNGGQISPGGSMNGNSALDCDQLSGTLRWCDLPDPAGTRPVNTRSIMTLENETYLCTTLKNMNHKFVREIIQECYRFVHGNVTIELSRYLQLPDTGEIRPFPKISNHLPPFASLTPFDAENKWMLMASVRVANSKDPEQIQQGISELMTIKTEFEGCFDFHMIDRHTLDTRVKLSN